MPGTSIVRFADQYIPDKQQETLVPWLVYLDRNQDGQLEKTEVSDPKGYLRCDTWLPSLGGGNWRSLEGMLKKAGLVGKRSPQACTRSGKPDPELPVAPQGRLPAERLIQFFAQPFDWNFTLRATPKKLLRVLKPETAKVVRSKGSIRVELNSGRQVEILVNKSGDLHKIQYFGADGKYSLLARLEFIQIVRDAGLFEKYFAPNPYYDEERAAWQHLYSIVYTYRKVPLLSLEQANKYCWKGILLFPDLHGNSRRHQALYHMLKEETLDWFALEMLPHNLQDEVDDFISLPDSSKKFKEAKRKIQNSLQAFWAGYYKQYKDPDDNPYYQLLALCRKRGIKVVALDSMSYYVAASQKITPLSVATRNLIWAKHIPAEGRGIVYGGQAHFTMWPKARVQDFLWEQDSERTIHLLTFSKQ